MIRFLRGGAVRLCLAGVIGDVPSGALQMEAAVRNKLMKLSGTVLTFDQRFIREFLKDFFNFTAFRAFVFVYRHLPATPIVNVSFLL